MERERYSERFAEICAEMVALTGRKGSDYAGASNVFRNFEFIEQVTEGRVNAVDGLLVRMSDKFMRASNLLTRDAQVADEKVTDTLLDLACYSIILKIMLENRAAAKCDAEMQRCQRSAGDQELSDAERMGATIGHLDWYAEQREVWRNEVRNLVRP